MNPNDRLGFILGESRGKEKKTGRSLVSVLPSQRMFQFLVRCVRFVI